MTATNDEITPPGPLAGLRIIDLSTYVAGPSATMTMAQLGAEVIRIDPIGGATDTSRLPLDAHGNSLYWAGLNKAKRSVEIDTSSPEGRQLVTALVAAPGAGNGIVVTNAVGQAWLSYEALSAQRPDLIQVHIGGRSDGKPAVDYTVNCEVGLPLLTGPVDFERPVNHVLPAWDLLTGLQVALAVVSAERVRSDRQGSTRDRLARRRRCRHDGPPRFRRRRRRQRARPPSRGQLPLRQLRQRLRHGRRSAGDDRRADRTALAQPGRHDRADGDHRRAERSLDVDLAQEESRYEYREVLTALLSSWFAQRSFDEVTPGSTRAGCCGAPTGRSSTSSPTRSR